MSEVVQSPTRPFDCSCYGKPVWCAPCIAAGMDGFAWGQPEATFPDAELLAKVEDVRLALERIMDGATTLDAEALLDALSDVDRTVQ